MFRIILGLSLVMGLVVSLCAVLVAVFAVPGGTRGDGPVAAHCPP